MNRNIFWIKILLLISLITVACGGFSELIDTLDSQAEPASSTREDRPSLGETPQFINETGLEATIEARVSATIAAQSGLPIATLSPSSGALQLPTPVAFETLPTPEAPLPSQHFRLDQRAHSDQNALQNVDLILHSAELTPETLTLRIALENTTDKEFIITGSFNERNALLVDAAGLTYEPLSISENLRSVSPPGGFAPGAANVGNLTFARPGSEGPYELRLLSYDPIQFRLDTPGPVEAQVTVPVGEYPLQIRLTSSQEALAPIELRMQSVQVEADRLTFKVSFANTSRQIYDLLTGPTGKDAWLMDVEGSQYKPVAVSESLQNGIDPSEGWQPGQEHPGAITFPRPKAMQMVRFLFSQYSALTLTFDQTGLINATVTSATGGEAPPTPVPSAEEQTFAALSHLLADQAIALLAGNASMYLNTFTPELRPEQQVILERVAQMPLETYLVEISPTANLSSDETGLIKDIEVEIRYTLSGLPADNSFSHIVYYDFSRAGGTWHVSAVNPQENPPFWWSGEMVFHQTDHFLIFIRPEMVAELPVLTEEAETAYVTLAGHGLPLEPRYVAYFTAGQDDFQNLTGQQVRVLGLATSRYILNEETIKVSSRAFYINGEAFVTRLDELNPTERQSTITHELVHLALAVDTRPFTPPWLAEGMAVYFAGQNTPEARRLLIEDSKLASLSLEQLTRVAVLGEHDFLGQRVEYEYIFSGEVINYLVEKFGEPQVLAFYRSYTEAPAAEVRDKMPRFTASLEVTQAIFADLSEQLTVTATRQFFNLTPAELDRRVKDWLMSQGLD